MAELFKTASAFRAAIEETVRAGELPDMQSFPRGCCGFASDLLQRYLAGQGIFTWYISGRYGYGWNGESHAWLETQDKTVIDITGDQYKHKKMRFDIPVYVGPRVDGFHDKFELGTPIPYQVSKDPFGRNRKANERYDAVMRHLQ